MDSDVKLFRRTLRKNHSYITPSRVRLFQVLQKYSPLSIHELIDRSARYDQSTVYRNLLLFERLGIVSRLQLGWNSKVELSDQFTHHHHHLSCVQCGRIVTLAESPALEREIVRLNAHSGYKLIDHQLELKGLCVVCQKKN